MSFNWFNLSSPGIVWNGRLFKLWNAFRRVYSHEWAERACEPAHQWGFGVVQIGHRHMLYIGHASIYVAFFRVL